MTVKMDSAGRIILPKPVRDHLGLTPGAEFELSEQNGRLTLSPTQGTSGLEKKDGRWVFCGKLPPGFDFQKFIEDEREERIRQQGGW
jgi:AbrB family looped-hinge helix DNA binding protein